MSTLIKPLRGLRPAANRAADILAPPYDVLNSAEARVRARGKPWSFLHISKPEIDLPENIDPYDAKVYARGADNFRNMIAAGALIRDPSPCYYVYRLRMGSHVQTGLVCTGSVAAYDSNRIRKHEFTRPDKENDRVRQITALQAQTGPVLLAYQSNPAVKQILESAAQTAALYQVSADDGIEHTLWQIGDKVVITELTRLFDDMERLYIADGHHRSAAASRVAASLRTANPEAGAEAFFEHFLCVAFPQDEMKILDYNRVVSDLKGHSPDTLLAAIAGRLEVLPADAAVQPAQPAEFGMYLDGRWHRLRVPARDIPADPVASLDVSLLQDQVLEPLLGIHDPRTDARIDFVGGMRGLAELEQRVDSGEMAVAFSMYPTSMPALMAVADAGQVMPPKSTWFEPKLADGLVSHLLY